eukprot:gnl/TRDRNA2_/TRDRNA2_127512_c1_seq1.p1 gnl/TRDRNA2_/TRDRNA2_127512_c1~~gnl/TRDRNA2_/TRDRNA2_127512_c1_seq1.p1  ORF type:complete len:294 (-),score=40.58 gnl/TRDRNA2_/TRDRNA2_127512_c1_seq1:244-1065(-)
MAAVADAAVAAESAAVDEASESPEYHEQSQAGSYASPHQCSWHDDRSFVVEESDSNVCSTGVSSQLSEQLTSRSGEHWAYTWSVEDRESVAGGASSSVEDRQSLAGAATSSSSEPEEPGKKEVRVNPPLLEQSHRGRGSAPQSHPRRTHRSSSMPPSAMYAKSALSSSPVLSKSVHFEGSISTGASTPPPSMTRACSSATPPGPASSVVGSAHGPNYSTPPYPVQWSTTLWPGIGHLAGSVAPCLAAPCQYGVTRTGGAVPVVLNHSHASLRG